MTNHTLRRRTGIALIAVMAVLCAACAHVRIADVLADPTHWTDRDVTIDGRVVESLSVLGRGAYQLEDGTGRLWVVSTHGVPRQGARVSAKGQVKEAYDLSGLPGMPDSMRSAVVLMESEHHLKR